VSVVVPVVVAVVFDFLFLSGRNSSSSRGI
jgi:hypothetical protein